MTSTLIFQYRRNAYLSVVKIPCALIPVSSTTHASNNVGERGGMDKASYDIDENTVCLGEML